MRYLVVGAYVIISCIIGIVISKRKNINKTLGALISGIPIIGLPILCLLKPNSKRCYSCYTKVKDEDEKCYICNTDLTGNKMDFVYNVIITLIISILVTIVYVDNIGKNQNTITDRVLIDNVELTEMYKLDTVEDIVVMKNFKALDISGSSVINSEIYNITDKELNNILIQTKIYKNNKLVDTVITKINKLEGMSKKDANINTNKDFDNYEVVGIYFE